jgi:acyl dehydratase
MPHDIYVRAGKEADESVHSRHDARDKGFLTMSETYPELKRQPSKVFTNLLGLQEYVGQEVGVGEWHQLDQDRIDLFAKATGDFQWIHVNPERAAAGPFGGTIAHGYLTLSLLPMLMAEVFDFDNVVMTINYGLNKVRFPAPARSGSHVRARVSVIAVDEVGDAAQVVMGCAVESDSAAKPVCVAEFIVRVIFG